MNLRPALPFCYFLCFIGVSFLVQLSCSKDVDTLRDTVLKDETVLVSEEDSMATDTTKIKEDQPETIGNDSTEIKEEIEDITVQKDFESRTTVFPPVHDAYLQNGKGYDLSIVRLEEGRRTSYLMFDLSQIDSIGGTITEANVEFMIHTDDGNGKIEAFKGTSNEWTEENLSSDSAPEIDISLGSTLQEYRINTKTSIDLNVAELLPQVNTLILGHTGGDDLAFASKENKQATGSHLVVTYNAPVGSEIIVIKNDENNREATGEEENAENRAEDSTEEEVKEEENTDEGEAETSQEENDEGETSENETAEEEVEEAENTKEESEQEEETTQDGTTAEQTTDEEETEEVENTDGETTEEETAQEDTETEPIEEEVTQEEITTEENTEEETETENTEEENNEETSEEESTEEVSSPVGESNASPIAVADATPSKGTVPLKVTFTGTNSSDDKAVTTYEWNFGDGDKSATANPVHTFTEEGSYEVTLKTTDEEGLSSTDTVEITVESKSNEAPVAKASASTLSGIAPLEVSFEGNDSTDDNMVANYFWDFKDGSTSNKKNPSHSFDTPGNYDVELSVKDNEGLSDKAIVTITVNEPENQAPKAVASADLLEGEAPLEVNFTGSGSSDDKAIVTYDWDIPGNPSSNVNTTRTFNDPGDYKVTLTVTDEEGQTDTASLTVTVTEKSGGSSGKGQIACSEGGKRANDTGRKVWCWNNIDIPQYSGRTGLPVSQEELYIDSECYEKQVTKTGNRLKFRLNPTGPEVGDWCPGDFNKRAEIRTAPWNVRNPKGTEEWFGWTYTFGNDYKIDLSNQWKFFQVHPGPKGAPQQISLEVIREGQFKNHSAGEIYVVNACHGTEGRSVDFSPTGITPRAGQTIDIVVHVIWGDASNGLLQVWIEGSKVYDKKVATVLKSYPWGGNAKWGIYKWTWAKEDAVEKSIQQGISHVETFMGPLRMITRKPGDFDYGKDSYSEVHSY